MEFNLPPKVRLTLYVIVAISSPFVTYLADRGTIGTLEVSLFAGVVSAVSALAAINLNRSK